MEYNNEDCHAEGYLPTDLVNENYAEEDDMNVGVPVEVSQEITGDGGDPEAEQGTNSTKEYSLNHEYRNHLTELRRNILIEIQKCKEKQDIISKRILELEKKTINPLTRKNWYHLFGYPYFKDLSFFPCPVNEDHRLKQARKEIDYHKLRPIRRWTEAECKKLEEAVKANAIERKSLGLVRKRGIILEKLKSADLTERQRKELNDNLTEIKKAIENVKNLDPEVLFGNKNTQFDWMKITAEEFGVLRSSEEVQAMWVLCRHPSINKKHWTRSENASLFEIAKRHNEQDWKSIAEELNTNRSEFQCIVQYQRKVNTDFINHRWTEEEDEMLKYLIKRCSVNDYVPWATIAMCMKNRTRQQVYNRWKFCLNPTIKRGRFTLEEDCLLLAGIKHFGLDFPRIAEILPGRTCAQVNARYKMCLSRDGPLGQWSVEEDVRLLKLVEMHGKKWHWLALEHFRSRSRSQIRHRYNYLSDWLSKNPDSSVSKAPRRDLGTSRKRNSNLWSALQVALAGSGKKKRETKEICQEDIELLRKRVVSQGKFKRTNFMGRKKKVFTKADKLLHQLVKVCYTMYTGRYKAVFSEEEFRRRESISLNVLNALQSHLAFPFNDSVIMNDPIWNDSDESILLGLKEQYDKQNSCLNKSNRKATVITENPSGQCSAGPSEKRETGMCAKAIHSSSLVPFYGPQENMSMFFPEVFPGFAGNMIGFRTVLLSRPNLRMWSAVPDNKVVALPALRPTSQGLQDKGMKCLSKEESAKLFSERMFSLFFWPAQLARIKPDFDRNTFIQTPASEESTPQPPQSRKRKRTMRHQVRAKRLLMRERWKKIHGERSRSQSSNSSTRNAPKSKRKKSDLELS